MAFRGAALIVWALAIWHANSSEEQEDCREKRNIGVEKDEPINVTCTIPGAQGLSWSLLSTAGRQTIGSCQLSGGSACRVTGGPRYGLTGQEPHTSTLTIAPFSHFARMIHLVCAETTLENGTETDLGRPRTCYVMPMYPADQFKNCSLQWDSTNWRVSGFCELDEIYGAGIMQWEHHTTRQLIVIVTSAPTQMVNHKVRYEFRGYHINAMHPSGVFDVLIHKPHQWEMFVTRIPVEKPGDPELDNCPPNVTEGSNLTCLCRPSSSTPGTPRPVVTWTPKQAGDNRLHISNIQRESDNRTFTCYQYWGGWSDRDVRTVSYTVHVYSDEKDDSSTTVGIATGFTAVLIVVIIIVVIIIVKQRRGSKGNTAPWMLGPQTGGDHQITEGRIPSQDVEGCTNVRSAEPTTSAADKTLEPQPRPPQSADAYQGLQMDMEGQRTLYTSYRPGYRRLANE